MDRRRAHGEASLSCHALSLSPASYGYIWACSALVGLLFESPGPLFPCPHGKLFLFLYLKKNILQKYTSEYKFYRNVLQSPVAWAIGSYLQKDTAKFCNAA